MYFNTIETCRYHLQRLMEQAALGMVLERVLLRRQTLSRAKVLMQESLNKVNMKEQCGVGVRKLSVQWHEMGLRNAGKKTVNQESYKQWQSFRFYSESDRMFKRYMNHTWQM